MTGETTINDRSFADGIEPEEAHVTHLDRHSQVERHERGKLRPFPAFAAFDFNGFSQLKLSSCG
ncbi:hypothetical protein [Jannaschia sp. CCS1]|uniref:hypothetical protein n=1 Tax=Jannaschia sp. (strain CCS1) TaxID=290400 RepID=UPI00031B5E42|nr:hypothetical protein [Jannaschia sp. CCS1]